MDLAHRQAAPLQPAVELAELGVAVAVGVLLEVLEVEQPQGDAGLAPLGVQVGAVGDGAVVGGRAWGPYTRASSTSSVRASTWAQSSPAARARSTVSPTAPLLIPRLRATSRWLRPRLHFCRRISRVWRMDSRSVAIPPLSGADDPADVQRRYAPAIPLITILRSR